MTILLAKDNASVIMDGELKTMVLPMGEGRWTVERIGECNLEQVAKGNADFATFVGMAVVAAADPDYKYNWREE